MTGRGFTLFPVVLLLASLASAQPESDVELRAAAGALPLELARDGNDWAGELVFENRGTTAVDVSVRPRAGTELLPRLPPTVSATFSDAKSVARLEPGQSRTIALRWAPGHGRRPRELYGQIEVELDASRRVVAGFHADTAPSVLGGRPLSALLALPLLGLVALAALARWRRGAPRLWALVAAVGAAQLALACAVHAEFVPALNRYDGNDGFQFIERFVLEHSLGIEYALGVDGLSVGLVALTAFAILGAALLGTPWRARHASYWGFVLLVDLGVVGALLATDLALVFGFWWLSLLGAAALIAGDGAVEGRRAAARFAAFSALAFTLVLLACLTVARSAGAGYLVDGAETRRVFSIPDLSHVELTGRGLAMPYVAIVLGLGALMGLSPLNAWLSETTARVSAAVALLVNLGTVTVAGYLLLRIGYGVLPRATVWAAPALGGAALFSVFWAGLTSVSHGDLRRVVAAAGAMKLGIALLSFSSMTAIGVAGYVVALQSHTLALVLWFGLLASLEKRGDGAEIGRIPGALAKLPLLLPVVVVAGLSLLGVPGSFAFVALMLALFGALPMQPLAAAGAVLTLLAISFFQLRRLRNTWPEPAVEQGAAPLPLGARERAVLLASAIAIVVAGAWPAPALSVIGESALDQAARVNPPGPLEIVEQRGDPGPSVLARSLLFFPEIRRGDTGLSDSSPGR